VYRRFRLPGAPAPVCQVAGVDSFNIIEAVAFLTGEYPDAPPTSSPPA
jgi:hypothetical protein